MPRFTLIGYETTRLEMCVEAATVTEAITKWDPDACDEETLGTNGVEAVYDDKDQQLYSSEGCDRCGAEMTDDSIAGGRCTNCGSPLFPKEVQSGS